MFETSLKRKLHGTVVHRLYRRILDRVISGLPAGTERNAFYDSQTVEVMHRILREDSSCIDVGAHEGTVLRHMVAIAPAGMHHAFEPLPHLAARLRESFPAVRVHEAAVGERNEVSSEFQFVVNDPGYSGLRRRLYDRSDPAIVAITVNVVTLDETIPPEQAIHFVKIDIEGGEYHALKGGRDTILRCRPVIVFEAAENSTGQYGVEPGDLFELVTRGLGEYELSTMTRWLRGRRPLTIERFCHNWQNGPDFYFIATPARG